jgi:hypothetical protein
VRRYPESSVVDSEAVWTDGATCKSVFTIL